MVLDKVILYYTDNNIQEPICSLIRDQIKKVNLPIVSVSLKPIAFGRNHVIDREPSYITMIHQIIKGLEESKSLYVFFCEHDVLYPESHFDFTPLRNDIFYYNDHIWRWDYPNDRLITYDRLMSLSSLCVNRELVLSHYNERLAEIYINGWQDDDKHEPEWARKWGYEPGTKKIKRGGFSDDDFETWKSEEPIIDIRHKNTFSRPKVHLTEFKHQPENFKETTLDQIKGWKLKEMFEL